MSIFSYLRRRNTTTANVAKERLQIIISHERAQQRNNYLPQLQEEILAVISKYVPIERDQVSVNLERSGDSAVLELNVTMPEESLVN